MPFPALDHGHSVARLARVLPLRPKHSFLIATEIQAIDLPERLVTAVPCPSSWARLCCITKTWMDTRRQWPGCGWRRTTANGLGGKIGGRQRDSDANRSAGVQKVRPSWANDLPSQSGVPKARSRRFTSNVGAKSGAVMLRHPDDPHCPDRTHLWIPHFW